MSSTTDTPIDIPTLLRFLTQTASLPLALAMSKIPSLRVANLTSSTAIASAPFKMIKEQILPEDEKLAKKLHAAAKREAKKRKAGDDEGSTTATPSKKRKQYGFSGAGDDGANVHDEAQKLEKDLLLPSFDAYFPIHTEMSEIVALLNDVVLVTNRAPLLLAFTLVLLQFTMPEQPLSSRLSLAQAVVSEGARKRARALGIVTADNAAKAEEEGWGTGQKGVKVMGRNVSVMKRGFGGGGAGGSGEEEDGSVQSESANIAAGAATATSAEESKTEAEHENENDPPEPSSALWALDLEALKSSNTITFSSSTSSISNLPIHQPHGARNYLMKSFATHPTSPPPPFTQPSSSKTKKYSQAQTETHTKAANVALLLKALEMVFESWAVVLSKEDLDRRAWGWYVRVRPEVEEGKAGWGGKGEVRLGRVLGLRRVVEDVKEREDGKDTKVVQEEEARSILED